MRGSITRKPGRFSCRRLSRIVRANGQYKISYMLANFCPSVCVWTRKFPRKFSIIFFKICEDIRLEFILFFRHKKIPCFNLNLKSKFRWNHAARISSIWTFALTIDEQTSLNESFNISCVRFSFMSRWVRWSREKASERRNNGRTTPVTHSREQKYANIYSWTHTGSFRSARTKKRIVTRQTRREKLMQSRVPMKLIQQKRSMLLQWLYLVRSSLKLAICSCNDVFVVRCSYDIWWDRGWESEECCVDVSFS